MYGLVYLFHVKDPKQFFLRKVPKSDVIKVTIGGDGKLIPITYKSRDTYFRLLKSYTFMVTG